MATPAPTMALDTRPLVNPDGTSSFGVEVEGLDLKRLSGDQLSALAALWSDEPLILVRNQLLGEDDLMALSANFGELETVVRKDIHSPYHPEIAFVSNLFLEDGTNIGGLGNYELRWHTDQSYRVRPATGAIFFAVEVPPEGGNTRWLNTVKAYEALPGDVKAEIDGRNGLFAYQMYNTDIKEANAVTDIRDKTPDARHPLVLTHPMTGVKSLYFDPAQTYAIEGLSAARSEALVALLGEHLVDPAWMHEHRWRMGDVMMWDNARLLHSRAEFDMRYPRLAKRTTIFLRGDLFPLPAPATA